MPVTMLPKDVRSSKGQQRMVRKGGANIAEALKLLALFEATQNIFEDDLERILREERNC
ncbi:MAG: hypothetical protein KAY22_10285 [Rhizorhabdus sp.]|uniref:hypothetical protein n=1 Tax=Rhizorhabdus sp. TaxID=1968843 RepID=UPI001B3CCFF9|nr:hypothetical protein [Rhizorhabdus sp.]MBP8232683.1 hypothetical protein [Rhizorhabdus sp.]